LTRASGSPPIPPASPDAGSARDRKASIRDAIRIAPHAILNGRELPARLLVLDAAGVAPNDPTNTCMAVDKLKALGFDMRYEGKSV
jgi:hypothetical protein